jgi:hypothetical protein
VGKSPRWDSSGGQPRGGPFSSACRLEALTSQKYLLKATQGKVLSIPIESLYAAITLVNRGRKGGGLSTQPVDWTLDH